MLSPKINQYIEDSKINGKLCRWNKSVISIFVTEITHQNVDKVFLYSEIQRAILLWNNTLHKNGININFEQINTPINADIITYPYIIFSKTKDGFEKLVNRSINIDGRVKKYERN